MDRLQESGKIRFWGVSVIDARRRHRDHPQRLGLRAAGAVQRPQPGAGEGAVSAGEGERLRHHRPRPARFRPAQRQVPHRHHLRRRRRPPELPDAATARRRSIPRVDEVKSIIGGTARALAEGALRFVLANDAVSTTIPGARNVRQVEIERRRRRGALPQDVVDKLRTRLGDYNFYQRHGIRIQAHRRSAQRRTGSEAVSDVRCLAFRAEAQTPDAMGSEPLRL